MTSAIICLVALAIFLVIAFQVGVGWGWASCPTCEDVRKQKKRAARLERTKKLIREVIQEEQA
jgi:hypothetical protein